MKIPNEPDLIDWTGEPDVVSAAALAIALIIGAIGFLIIGAIVSS